MAGARVAQNDYQNACQNITPLETKTRHIHFRIVHSKIDYLRSMPCVTK